MCHQLVVHAFGPPPRGHRRNLNRFLMFLLMYCCYCTAVVQPLLQLEEPKFLLERPETADQQDFYRDDDHGSVNEDDEDEETNTTGKPQNRICRNSRVLFMLTGSVVTTWHNIWSLTGNFSEGNILT